MALEATFTTFTVGFIVGAALPTIGYMQARKRIKKLEGLIKLHALGENLIQSEAKSINASN